MAIAIFIELTDGFQKSDQFTLSNQVRRELHHL